MIKRETASALQALDIDVWVPRQPLGGRVAEHFFYVEQESPPGRSPLGKEPSALSNEPSAPAQRVSRAADVSALIQPSDSERSTNRRPNNQHSTNKSESVNDSAAVERAPSLEWLCLFYKDWLFVDDVTGLNTVKSAYSDWMQALLFSLGLYRDNHSKAFTAELPIRRLKWPPTQNLAQSLSTSKGHGARHNEALSQRSKAEYVEGWFERQHSLLGRDVKYMVLMGEQAQRAFLESKETTASYKVISNNKTVEGKAGASSNVMTMFSDASLLLAPVSSVIWSSAESKKAFWQALVSLKQAE